MIYILIKTVGEKINIYFIKKRQNKMQKLQKIVKLVTKIKKTTHK